ncbi:MAG: 50S ribosomal protein L11 methyltransferase [Leptospirales bacterium]
MEYYKQPDEEFWELTIQVLKTSALRLEKFFIESGALGSYELLYQEGVTKNLEEEYTMMYFFYAADFPVEAFTTMALEVLGLGDCSWEVQKKKFADYLNSMEQTFRSFPLTDSLLLVPPWDIKENQKASLHVSAGPKTIIIKPAFAFGTGKHETTLLMVKFLEDSILPEDNIIEIGTGSGILCLAGLIFGAASANGADIETLSIQNANENLALNLTLNPEANLIQGSCHFEVGDFDAFTKIDVKDYVFISNILPKVFYQNNPQMKHYLTSSRSWALSGINNESAPDFEKWLQTLVPEQKFARKTLNDWNIFYREEE